MVVEGEVGLACSRRSDDDDTRLVAMHASCGWPCRPVVPNMVMFYDIIGASVSVFGQFPTN
jgi:hypothetical protein